MLHGINVMIIRLFILLLLAADINAAENLNTTNFVVITNHNIDNLFSLNLITNVTTEWITVQDCRPSPKPFRIDDLTNAFTVNLAILRFDIVKQVGVNITNRVLQIFYEGKTNEVILSELGRDEWPSQKRTLSIPR